MRTSLLSIRIDKYKTLCLFTTCLFLFLTGVVDPYERKWLKVGISSVPESGEGVFAQRDIPANRSLSLYSGFLFRSGEQLALHNEACKDNTSRYENVTSFSSISYCSNSEYWP